MKLEVLKLGYLETNCYFLIKNNNVLVIDPADSFKKIKEKIGSRNLVGVITTHNHPDHIGALQEVLNHYNTTLYSYSNMKEGKNIIGDFQFEVIYTPGHTSDSITLYFEVDNAMFVGDFIFKDSIGRTDLPTGDPLIMRESINRIKKYPNVRIYPGHGEFTSLRYEINNNYYFN